MKQNEITVVPNDSSVVFQATNGSTPFSANPDGTVRIHRDSIALMIAVLAEQLTGQRISSASEQRHANAALRALRAYLEAPGEHVKASRSWL